MTTTQTFQQQYDALQVQWRQSAIEHEHQYLPYLALRGPVDFVLVAKMTSIKEQDVSKHQPGEYPDVDPPHFNLLLSLGDLSLHYGARRHLCKPGETYYITDLSKCARPAKLAKGKIEKQEFEYWYPMLLRELELVAKPTATVIPVGSATGAFLKEKQSDFLYPLKEPILQWSRAATAAAKMASSFFPEQWREFLHTTRWEDLLASTREILTEAGLGQYVDSVDSRFKGQFADIHKHYMFTYKAEMPLRRPNMG